MTVAELRRKLKQLPQGSIVYTTDAYGDIQELRSVEPKRAWSFGRGEITEILLLAQEES